MSDCPPGCHVNFNMILLYFSWINWDAIHARIDNNSLDILWEHKKEYKKLYSTGLRYDMENFSGVIKRSYNIPVELCGTLGPNKSDGANGLII